MDKVSYTNARQHLKSIFDAVCENHVPVTISRKHGDSVVIISENDFRSLEETAYLMKSQANVARLIEAMNREEGVPLADVRKDLGI